MNLKKLVDEHIKIERELYEQYGIVTAYFDVISGKRKIHVKDVDCFLSIIGNNNYEAEFRRDYYVKSVSEFGDFIVTVSLNEDEMSRLKELTK